MNDRLSHGSPKPVYISARACEELDADVLPPGRNYKTKGQQIATPDIRLREGVKTRQLIVRLAWEGTPPENMPLFVLAESNKRDMPVTQRLEPGVFFVTMREDARYTIHGESYCRPFAPVKTKDITVNGADGSSQELQLTLAKSLCATN
jgi:hypothetical protein